MLRYLLAADTCLRVLQDRPAHLRPLFNAQAASLCTSTIVLAELLHAAATAPAPADHRREVERFAARLAILPFDQAAASHAADLQASLNPHGNPLSPYQVLVAGQARSRGLTLITTTPLHHLPTLLTENWLPHPNKPPPPTQTIA